MEGHQDGEAAEAAARSDVHPRYDIALDVLKIELDASDSLTGRCVAVAALSGVIIGLLGAFSRVWISRGDAGDVGAPDGRSKVLLIVLLVCAVVLLLLAVRKALSAARPEGRRGVIHTALSGLLCSEDRRHTPEPTPHQAYFDAVRRALADGSDEGKLRERVAAAYAFRFEHQLARNRGKATGVRSAYAWLLAGIVAAAVHVIAAVVVVGYRL